jgi:hypothetical protein
MKGWDTKMEKHLPHFDILPAITSFSINHPPLAGWAACFGSGFAWRFEKREDPNTFFG